MVRDQETLSKEQYKFWKSLPETQLVQYLIFQKVNEARLELISKLGRGVDKEQISEKAAFLAGMEFGHSYDDLFDYGEDTNADSEGAQDSGKTSGR
jgi:hypothetical protein